jgi:hypothetical protein
MCNPVHKDMDPETRHLRVIVRKPLKLSEGSIGILLEV